MNSRYILVAVSFVVQQGCTSYYELTKEEIDKGMIPSETTIHVTRNDSSVVESGPFRHALVREPSDFVIGVGSERKSGRPFAGAVPRSEIDSARQIQFKSPNGAQQTYFLFWLKNKTSPAFAEYDYLDITPEHQPGLWCAGTVTHGDQARPFKGRIDSSTVKRIEDERIAIVHPSLPTSGGAGAGQFQWATLGIGAGPAPKDAHEPPAFLLGLSFLSKASLYSARFTTSFKIPGPEEHHFSHFSVFELAALYGAAFKSRFLTFSASAGISYVFGSEEITSGSFQFTTIKYSTASFPLDIELAITPFNFFGISIKYFSTSNSMKSWRGVVLCLQGGKL